MPSIVETSYEPLRSNPQSKLEGGASKSVGRQPQLDIIDIRHAAVEINVKGEIPKLLRPQEGPRRLPTLLLYDEKGLQLFEKVLEPMCRNTLRYLVLTGIIDYILGRVLLNKLRDPSLTAFSCCGCQGNSIWIPGT